MSDLRTLEAELLPAIAAAGSAAAEAHAVATINGVPSWSQIYGVYQDLDKFTKQLRQLESDARQHPQDVHAQFLLGFLYMTMGYRAEAQEHLAQVVQQMPNDRLAANLLSEAGGQVPATASRSNAPQSYDRTTPDQPMNPVAPRTPPAGPPADSRGSGGGIAEVCFAKADTIQTRHARAKARSASSR